MNDLATLLTDVRACTLCRESFDHEPRPVLRASATARLLIVGQAPGTRVHATGIPWNDPSGNRLREWLRLDKDVFYDEGRIAIMPMGFCFPGQDDKGADLPPRPECARTWHPPLLEALPQIDLTLLVGSYAQKYYLEGAMKKTMTEIVCHWRDYLPRFLTLPHPSWRNTGWLKKNPWFEKELLPELQARVRACLVL